MTTLTIELPEEAFSALRRSPPEFTRQMRLAAAIHWYARGEISQEKAAFIAGLDRADFLDALAAERIDVFQVDVDSFQRQLRLPIRHIPHSE
jgi:predicted HTH domain antitoxin